MARDEFFSSFEIFFFVLLFSRWFEGIFRVSNLHFLSQGWGAEGRSMDAIGLSP